MVRYELKTPYRDGTTHVIFEPVDFIAKLAGQAGQRQPQSGSGSGREYTHATPCGDELGSETETSVHRQ